MHRLTATPRPARIGIAPIVILIAIVAGAAAPTPARAQLSFGFDWWRYDAPSSYYYPPPAYYPYYPPAYYPPAAAGYSPPPAAAPAPPSPMPITYTGRPAFTNAAGQVCREYLATLAAGAAPVYGTACRDANGQWRVAN
jgi:hypothetical protein